MNPLMTPRAAEALEASIRHWEENARAERPEDASIGVHSCALCGLFFWQKIRCSDCPVAIKTKQKLCGGTPYEVAAEAFIAWDESPGSKTARDAFRAVAQAEVDFLKSLREV